MFSFFKTAFIVAITGSYLLVKFPINIIPWTPSYIASIFLLYFIQLWSWVFCKVILYPKFLSPIRHMPGPSGGSFWNGQFKRLKKEMNGAPAAEWMRQLPHQDMYRYLGLLNSERVVVTSTPAIAEVLNRDLDFPKPGVVTKLAGPVLGLGLILSEGQKHKEDRKLVMPSFAVKNIKDLFPVFWDKSKEVVRMMTKMVKDQSATQRLGQSNFEKAGKDEAVFEVGEWTSRVGLDIITLAALGKDFGAIQNPNTTLNETYRTVFTPTRTFTALALLKNVLPSRIIELIPVKHNGEMERASKVIRGVCREIIREKRSKLLRGALDDIDIVSLIIRDGKLEEEDIIDQMTTMLGAGHETSSVSVTWAVYMLCLHPHWQKILREEVRANLPTLDGEGGIRADDIERLPYLNAFCREVLRYWPPVSMTARETARDLELCGQKIPQGTRVILAMIMTNRDEQMWGPDARIFRPERWLDGSGKAGGVQLNAEGGSNTKYGFLTFLHGQRSCIGHGFARGEMACLVASLVGRFEFSLKNEYELDERNLKISGGGLSAKPVDGMWVRARIVEGW